MNEIIYLILQRMRPPALVLLIAYSIAILGIVLIPMSNNEGEITHMSLFEAFYWVSFTATTIGYGEIPAPFSDWQRLWVAISIYYTVPAWLYAAGKIIALLSDPLFHQALTENRFSRRIAKLNQRFVIICGFGEPGKRLATRLQHDNYRCVVIDQDKERINRMALDPELHNILAVSGDASHVELLVRAGIRSPYCRALIAITDNEAVNIKASLSANLLTTDRNRIKIICRTMSVQGSANARALESDFIINTNRIFSERITMALRRPALADLMARLNGTPGNQHETPPQPPSGTWIICGYSALGQNLAQQLEYAGVDTIILDEHAEKADIKGHPTSSLNLREARIDRAQAIVASMENDSDNLSIAMSSKKMQPSLFVVGRQNQSNNERLFDKAGFDYVMEEADLILSEIHPYLARNLLSRFMRHMRHQDEKWTQALNKKIDQLCGTHNPYQYVLKITDKHAPAITKHLKGSHLLRLQTLWMMDKECAHQVLPLFLLREQKEILLPNPAMNLQKNDQILLLYHDKNTVSHITRNCYDESALYKTLHGREKINSKVLNFILKKWE